MADENEVVVTIEPELPGLETGTESDAAKDLASQFEEMKVQAERDRTARESADRRTREARADAAKAREEADAARGAVAESQLETVTSGLSAAESEATAAEAAIATAMEAGNFIEVAKQQRRMARAEAQAERLREAQSDIEARKTARPEPEVRRERERERVPPADDPVEAYIAGRTEPTAVWLRAHTDFITDKRKNAKLTAGHHDAVADGLAPDSREYFDHVETFIGLRQSETGTDNRTGNGSRPSPKPQRRPSVPAAPVTSSAGGTNGGGAEVRLTRKEADAATDGTLVWNYDDQSGQKRYKKGDPLGVQEVARRKLARLKERGIENPNIES